ncbi:isoaspartyl peptidase/L-asparaginase isoform X5 [Anguilla rostrata]|uniref:isoaspartyl peptidase/L-asparaginase isoform X5 n=1 Tax=Anguilla rostrata TaxID=7938 RepID=UPI0030D276D6
MIWSRIKVASVTVASNSRRTAAAMLPVLVVHGGAGDVPTQRAELSCAGVREAARAGYALLRSGRSAMDAVVEAVTLLENNPAFNAGCGSVLNEHGGVEMDALVMDGRTLASGAVSAVRRIANPVQLARLVMEKTQHLCLTAEGASKFARAVGVPEVPEETLITDYARKRWQRNLQPGSNPVECQMGKMGTVGAVAVDSEGNVACATSTGGMLNKMEGRVGDTPCVVVIKWKYTLCQSWLTCIRGVKLQSWRAAANAGLTPVLEGHTVGKFHSSSGGPQCLRVKLRSWRGHSGCGFNSGPGGGTAAAG